VRNEVLHAAETVTLWDSPVAAVSRDLALFTIGSPSEAFDFLCNEWPARQGSIFADARKLAVKAICGAVPADEARTAFVKACDDAGCLVRYR
jgi:hypothetical protein